MELAPETLNKNRIANYRPVFVFALGLMLGVAACGSLENTGVILLAVLLAVFAGALFILRSKRFAVFVISIIIGLSLAFLNKPKAFQAGNCSISGVVIDSYRSDDAAVLILKRCTVNGESYNKRIELLLNDSPELRIGDEVSALADCRMLRSRTDQYSEYSSKLSIGIGCVASAREINVLSSHNAPLTELTMGLRNSIKDRIDGAFGSDSGIFNALIIGVKNEVGDERYTVFSAVGTSHLLAISGLHMSILVACVSALIPKRKKWLNLVLLGAFMLVYCTVAAYAPGLVRAAIMMFTMLAADCFGRQRDSLSALSIAAAAILAFCPYQLYSIGFQLSFSACFGIILLTRSLGKGISKAHVPAFIAQPAAVCLAAALGTFSFQMRYFKSFTPYALIANLAVVPLFSIVIITAFAVTVIAFIFPGIASAAAIVPRSILFCVEKLLSLHGRLPFAEFRFRPPSMLCCVIWLVMLFAVSEYTLRPRSKRSIYAACMMVLFTTVYFAGIIRA